MSIPWPGSAGVEGLAGSFGDGVWLESVFFGGVLWELGNRSCLHRWSSRAQSRVRESLLRLGAGVMESAFRDALMFVWFLIEELAVCLVC